MSRAAERWLRVRPDYLLEDESTIEKIARKAGGTPDRFEVHASPTTSSSSSR